MKSPKFWILIVLLLAATVVLRVRGDVDRVPVSEPLSQMPETLGPWTGTDVPLEADVLQVLGKGVFLNRTYKAEGAAAGNGVNGIPIGLFIGYFPTQRTGQAIHSPQHCLPGAGWVFETSGVTDLKGDNGHKIQVGEYVISDGTVKAEVLYWYRSHGRSIADDYKAKMYTLLDSIRYSRTDAALVRIVTPIVPNESREQAHRRAAAFAEQMNPLLPAFIPN
ncbi:MAG: exosortase C-terminal domain/associated protein EpsI [Acidobacteriaceae bacterium]